MMNRFTPILALENGPFRGLGPLGRSAPLGPLAQR
jgi:hypothetical protein